MSLGNILFGRRISTEEDENERVGPIAGVAVLGLDALASASYGPEALLTVLLPLGRAGLNFVTPIIAAIIALLVLVAVSYRQTIRAYPGGGGAYTVAKENLGTNASLFAAAALALDYLLNAAVAISAGVGALVSAFPLLLPHTVPLCLSVLALLTLLNLRGVRATGLVFTLPTYMFVTSLFAVIGVGILEIIAHDGSPPQLNTAAAVPATLGAASLWLLLHAFANGCTAMTGIEAVSNGVPIFKPPEVVGAQRTLAAIAVILVVLLLGIATLAEAFGVTATVPGKPGYESVVSRVTAAAFGRGAAYYVTLGSVMTVLMFSANTSFADFPRVCRMLAADRFLPEPFVHRGRRLTFSHGIVVLGVLAAGLLVIFAGITDALIPLFAVGALSAFTLSQAGMVAHWRKQAGPHARYRLAFNLLGCSATGITLVIVIVAKFTEGGWIALLLAAAMIVLFKNVRRHYDFISHVTATDTSLALGPPRPPLVIVPMRRWDGVTLKALRFAIGLADEVIAVQVLTGDRDVDDLTERWDELAVRPLADTNRQPPRLVVLRSEYRQLYSPLLELVRRLERDEPDRQVAVVVPELVEPRWYHHLLHNHTASLLKTLLLFRGGPQVVIINTPWYLGDWMPERRQLLRSSRAREFASWWQARRKPAPSRERYGGGGT